jgi:hypothetical protein
VNICGATQWARSTIVNAFRYPLRAKRRNSGLARRLQHLHHRVTPSLDTTAAGFHVVTPSRFGSRRRYRLAMRSFASGKLKFSFAVSGIPALSPPVCRSSASMGLDHTLRKALHLLELRTELQQQQIRSCFLERSHPLGDLFGSPDEP